MDTEQQLKPRESAQSPRAARPEERPVKRPEGQTPSDDGVWTSAEVARYLHVPVGAIYKMTFRGASVRIPHVRLGGRLRFRRSDIDRWLGLLTVSNLDVLTRMRKHTTG